MSQTSDTIIQCTLHTQMLNEHETTDQNFAGISLRPCYTFFITLCKVGLTDTVAEGRRYSVSSTVFGSWERFRGGLRRSLPEWSAEVALGERPQRNILEEVGHEGSLVNASRGGDRTKYLGCGVATRVGREQGDTTLVRNRDLVAPKPRYPLLRHTSAPSIFGVNRLGGYLGSLRKGDRRAYSLSIYSSNSIFPFPSDAGRATSPPASMYELAEFLQQDSPRAGNSPETWLPCPQIPRNNPIISYFEETAPRPKIPHLVDVTEQPRDFASSVPHERVWWNCFHRSGGASSRAVAHSREETTIRALEFELPLMEHDLWSIDVEAANTPRTPLTEEVLLRHQKSLRYKARMFKLRATLQRAWGKFVDCFLLVACAIWWFISGCGRGLFGR
ncbi:hypothetical protein HOY80DRAFT_970211 [Tuber brumale]|nr:hypothetical protein HOY80DRAFT_970211 [Tuber brumale]